MNKLTRDQKLATCRLYKGELNNPFNDVNTEDFDSYVKLHIWNIEDVFVNGDYWEQAYQREHPETIDNMALDAHDYVVDSKIEKMSCGDEELLSKIRLVYNAI